MQEALGRDIPSDDRRQQMENRLITAKSVARKLDNEQKRITSIETGPVSVLVVDDVDSVLMTHKQVLLHLGFKRVDSSSNGLDAFKKIMQAYRINEPYGLIICDWEMPKMSGLDLLQKVRDHKSLWSLPFFLVTGRDNKRDMLSAINLGVTGYMTKPINPAVFQENLSDYL